MTRTYFVRTYGCQMNTHDSERAAGLLETVGYRPAPSEDDADLVLLNTCAVRENADNKLYGKLGHLKAAKQERGLTVVVGGCLAQKDGDAIVERAPWVDVVYGTHNLGSLPRLLEQADSARLPVVELVEQLETFPSALPAKREVRHHAWVSISVGCNNTCTFCIVPSLRGRERSRRIGDIVHEVRALVSDGVIEVTLLGQNVNSYGRDLGGRPLFSQLLRELGDVTGLERVRFTSPHPHDFTEDVLHAMAETPNVCEHLHLPLQSGSDRVLRRMRRSYRQQRYLDLFVRTRELLPEAALTTDIIVGFPGETEEDFEQTLAVVEEVGFDQAYTFQFSPRPGTPAADMQDDFVDPAAIRERYKRLEEVVRRHSARCHEALVGSDRELLIESPSKTDPSRYSGRTRGNHLVHLPTPQAGNDSEDAYAPGDFVTARIVEASTNYCVAATPTAVRRTAAGRAAWEAMQRGEGWRLSQAPPHAPASPPRAPSSEAAPRPPADTAARRTLPLVVP